MEHLNRKLFPFFKGRVALYAILEALGTKTGDEVILPGFTCVVVPNAILYLAAKHVYVDIDPETYNIDPQKIGKIITEKTRAIIVQHTFGIPAEMDKIMEVAKKYNLFVIEDSCHAIGSKYKGKEVGSFGDAAFFSSQWSKPITTGLGGWAVLNNPHLRENMEKLYSHFIEPSYRENVLLRFQYYSHSRLSKPSLFWFAQDTYRTLSRHGIAIGSSSTEELDGSMPEKYKKKMSQWQRDLLGKKLSEIKKISKHRMQATLLYEELLKEKNLKTVSLPGYYEPIFLRYPLLVKDKEKALKEAKKRHIEIGDWFVSPVHPNLEGWEKAGYQKGTCPIAEDICEHIINLPTHPAIGRSEIRKIVEFIGSLF